MQKRTLWTDSIEKQMEPFKRRTFSRDDIFCTQREALDSITVEIKNNQIISVGKSSTSLEYYRTFGFLGLIADCLKEHRIPDTLFIINKNDFPIAPQLPPTTWVPVFSFCKKPEDETLLMPFPRIARDDIGIEYGKQGRYGWKWLDSWQELSAKIQALNPLYPIDQKQKICLFAGHSFSWDQSRLRFAWLSQKYPEILKCRITTIVGECSDQEKAIFSKCTGEPIKMKEFGAYKYLLHLDGNTSSERLRCLLAFNSVVLKAESPFEEFYYPFLKPHAHYVPIDAKLETLMDTLIGLEQDPQRYRSISEEGQEFARTTLSYPSILSYVAELLRTYTLLAVS